MHADRGELCTWGAPAGLGFPWRETKVELPGSGEAAKTPASLGHGHLISRGDLATPLPCKSLSLKLQSPRGPPHPKRRGLGQQMQLPPASLASGLSLSPRSLWYWIHQGRTRLLPSTGHRTLEAVGSTPGGSSPHQVQ